MRKRLDRKGWDRSLLVMDFDGVICDSIEECFRASWSADCALRGAEPGEPPASRREPFRRLRPFVRSGEDFVLIQWIIASGRSARSQQEFDRQWEVPGTPSPQACREGFYAARAALRGRDPERWLAMNPVYPHVAEALASLSPRVPRYVLSTKRKEYVVPIIEAHRLPVPPDHVLYNGEEPKLAVVERLLLQCSRETAVFIEDQVDAIRGNRNPRISPFLAAWGYVQPLWLRDPLVSPLSARELRGLMATLR